MLSQNHEDFELIIVNDGSTDETIAYLRLITDQRVRIFNMPENKGKKHALTIGIENAKFDNLVFTDADCYPLTDMWLEKVSVALKTKDMAVGISQYESKGSILNEMIQFDTLFTIVQMKLSYLLFSKPHMAVGRNLAYKKEVFIAANGFDSHKDIPYGDDDLFVNSINKDVKITLLEGVESQTISIPCKSFLDWFNQKRRHLSGGMNYTGMNLWFALIFQQFWLWTSFGFLISFVYFNQPINLLFINLKLILWGFIWYSQRKYEVKIKWMFIPMYELLFTFYFLVVGISVIFAKKKEWS